METLKNRVDGATEPAVTAFAIDFPAYGQARASNELRKRGIFVSPSGVRSIWLRHNLASMKQRLAVLEKKSAEGGIVLTEAIETYHPGYLGIQDAFYRFPHGNLNSGPAAAVAAKRRKSA